MPSPSKQLERPRPLAGARLDSQLLEAEFFAHGLTTLRLSPIAFVAGRSGEAASWGFTRSTSAATGLLARRIMEDPDLLRPLLGRAGIATGTGGGEGRRNRALVVGERVVSLVDPSEPTRELVAQAPPALYDLLREVVSLVPGLPHAGVDLQLTEPRSGRGQQEVAVVAVDADPRLEAHRPPQLPDGRSIERDLVEHHLRGAGTTRQDRAQLELEVTLLGCSDITRARRLLRGTSRRLELEVRTHVRDDRVVAEVTGPTADAALLPAVVARRARRVHDVVRTRPVEQAHP